MSEILYGFYSKTGLTRVVKDSKGNVRIDSYFCDVRGPENHDRRSLNTSTGRFSGHRYNHKDKFDSDKEKSKSKSK